MSRERLAQMIQAHQDALAAAQERLSSGTEATILSILYTLALGALTPRQAQQRLAQHARLARDEPIRAALYREVVRELRRLEGGP
jgi:hypothetical protein